MKIVPSGMIFAHMRICPVNQEWVHTYLLAPYLQGAEMITRAWKGVDFHSLTRTPLSLKERVWSWLVGVSLMIPLVNIIIWIAWQAFGNPEQLYNPYCPITAPAVHVVVPPLQIPPPGPNQRMERFAYYETSKNFQRRVEWELAHYLHLTVAQKHHCDKSSSTTSIYKPDWTLSEFHHQSGEETFDAWLIDPKHIQVRLIKSGKDPIDQTFELTEPLTWIQQPTIGFQPFILSNNREMSCYMVLPKHPINPFSSSPLLIKGTAKKIRKEEAAGHGKLLKVEVVAAGWPYNLLKAELWFDPTTGLLRKFINPGLLTKKSGALALDRPLPALARP